MKKITRRDFIKYGAGGLATIIVGSQMDWLENTAIGAVRTQTLKFRITDAMKEMVTHNAINSALCYFWIYKSDTPDLPAECPGPNIFTTQGDTVRLIITNDLDEPHAFFIPGMFNSGPIAPGQTVTRFFIARKSGTFLYYDNLNPPVNRVMGLHGAFIVMPRAPVSGHKFTQYDRPTPSVQQLYDDFGSSAHFPGLSWEEGDPATDTPRFRQYIWLCHDASPLLFQEVGSFTPGQNFPASTFLDRFLNDPYADTFRTGNFNRKAHFFTIQGQSGHFSHNNPFICPNNRVGEPVLIRILNAGLHTHSMHIHANHVYVTSVNGIVQSNPLWVDTFSLHPLDTFDYTVPYVRPPDVPNSRGIGLPDPPRITLNGHPCWPPIEELAMFIPPVGTLADPLNPNSVDISVQLSPLSYPMHSHSEATQTAQGGNYNLGLIAGINFTGDRTTPGGVTTFPNAPLIHGPDKTGPAAG